MSTPAMPATGTHSVIGAWASLAVIVGGVLLFVKRWAR